MQAAATLIQLLNSCELITITVFLAVNIKLATCVNPDVIFLPQPANTKPSSTLLLLSRLMSANCTLLETYLNWSLSISIPHHNYKKIQLYTQRFSTPCPEKKRYPEVLAITLPNLSYFQWCNINGNKTDVHVYFFKVIPSSCWLFA